jgi:urease subunit beta
VSNEKAPNTNEAGNSDSVDNPFTNEDLTTRQSTHSPADDVQHPSDSPGREYEDLEVSEEKKLLDDDERERHPSSGPSSPSAPRRPGTSSRQSPRQESVRPVTYHDPVIPGEVFLQDDEIELNQGAEVTTLRVANPSDRPIQVGSHYHFAEVNPALDFDRGAAWGKRLNVLAGGAVRFEPGADEEIELIPLRGARIALGFRGECGGKLDG